MKEVVGLSITSALWILSPGGDMSILDFLGLKKKKERWFLVSDNQALRAFLAGKRYV
jgi:hypothetical protein